MKKITFSLVLTSISILCMAQNENWKPGDNWFDPRDSTSYKTSIIGKTVWLAENVVYQDTDGKYSINKAIGNDTALLILGGMKNQQIQGVCPSGWHIPTYIEWIELFLYAKNYNGYIRNQPDLLDGVKSLFCCSGNNGNPFGMSLGNSSGCWTNHKDCATYITASIQNTSRFSAIEFYYDYLNDIRVEFDDWSMPLEGEYNYVRCVKNQYYLPVEPDTLTFFIDSCNAPVTIETATKAGYNVSINSSQILSVGSGTVSSITIYNVSGQKIKETKMNSLIDVSDLSSGSYIALIVVDGQQIAWKFIR